MEISTIIQFFISGGGLLATLALFYKMGKFEGRTNEKFRMIESKLERIDKQFERIDQRLDKVEVGLNRLETRISILENRFDDRFPRREPVTIDISSEQIEKIIERTIKIIESKK